MTYQVTSRHFELPEVFKKYVEFKLTKFQKMFSRITTVSATIEKVKEGLFESKIQLQLPKKEVINSASSDHSIVRSFDDAFDKAFRTLRSYKDRLKDKGITARVTRKIKRNLT